MHNIATRRKTHEFRKYLIPGTVQRMWFYTSAPVQRLQYIAEISKGKRPGGIKPDDLGIGNEEFNAGEKESKFGYEILHLYQLKEHLNLEDLRARKFLKGPPQKYQWVSEEMMRQIPWEEQQKMF
jgi:hypothetical protein